MTLLLWYTGYHSILQHHIIPSFVCQQDDDPLRNAWLKACFLFINYEFIVFSLFVSGLSHLVGSSLLRAYMHGYFMDIRLYHKVRYLTTKFNFVFLNELAVLLNPDSS